MHGYGIAQHLRTRSDEVLQVGESSLYPALQRLLLNGWVKAEWGTSDNNRRARYLHAYGHGQEAADPRARTVQPDDPRHQQSPRYGVRVSCDCSFDACGTSSVCVSSSATSPTSSSSIDRWRTRSSAARASSATRRWLATTRATCGRGRGFRTSPRMSGSPADCC